MSAAPVEAAALKGTFVAHFGRGVGAPTDGCPAFTLCGVGRLSGFGAATDILDFTSFEPIDDTPCAAVTITETITLSGGADALVLDSEGTFCSPGASDSAPSSPNDYGHPHKVALTFTVNGGESTGTFARATGSGTKAITFAGDVATVRVTGQISLAD